MIISQMVTDSTNIATANTFEVACGLSTGIFTFDLGPLQSLGSRSCTFQLPISHKW